MLWLNPLKKWWKTLFISFQMLSLKVLKFLSWLFAHVEETAWLEKDKVNFIIYDVKICLTNNCNTHIAQNLTK